MLFSMLSLFIVTPKLTAMPAVYGIYSICLSLTFFLSYADIGFIGSAYKYASESYAKKQLREEIRIIGFVMFILLCFVILFSLTVLVFSFNPGLIIKDIGSQKEYNIASSLLLILAISSPFIIFQRFFQIVFGIRLEDYVFQRLSIILNLLRIASVFYFFSENKYDIVGFFLFYQVSGLILNILLLLLVKIRYKYDLKLLFSSLKFSREIYKKTKNLAYANLFTTVAGILYLELDIFVIGKFLGAEKAAFYGIGMIMFSFYRGIVGTIYSPFQARFNHFIGLNDRIGLKAYLLKVIVITMPLVIFPIVSLVILMEPFIYTWIGPGYHDSVLLSQLLVTCFILNFISQPSSLVITAEEKIKEMYLFSLFLVLFFWGGVGATVVFWGINSFAFFKLLSFIMVGIFYALLVIKYLEISILSFLNKIAVQMFIPLIFLISSLLLIKGFLPFEKTKSNLMLIIGTGGFFSLISILLYIVFSADFRYYFFKMIGTIFSIKKLKEVE